MLRLAIHAAYRSSIFYCEKAVYPPLLRAFLLRAISETGHWLDVSIPRLTARAFGVNK
jgi:hypothetical protein